MAARRHTVPGHLVGAGRVTLSRTGGGAGPDWGAYAVLYTTRPVDGGSEAVIGYCMPDDPLLDPAWGLHRQQPYGPAGTARHPLGDYAAASDPARGRSESPASYGQRMALFLLRIATATRLVHSPRITDLPWADWTLATEQHVHLAPDPDHPGRGGPATTRFALAGSSPSGPSSPEPVGGPGWGRRPRRVPEGSSTAMTTATARPRGDPGRCPGRRLPTAISPLVLPGTPRRRFQGHPGRVARDP